MSPNDAFDLIASAIKNLVPDIPTHVKPESFLMKDLYLESVDLLNLFVEIERQLKTRLDLTEIMRGRAGDQNYQRDLQIQDLMRHVERCEAKLNL